MIFIHRRTKERPVPRKFGDRRGSAFVHTQLEAALVKYISRRFEPFNLPQIASPPGGAGACLREGWTDGK